MVAEAMLQEVEVKEYVNDSSARCWFQWQKDKAENERKRKRGVGKRQKTSIGFVCNARAEAPQYVHPSTFKKSPRAPHYTQKFHSS